MTRFLMLALALCLGACATISPTAPQDPVQLIANLKATLVQQCQVAQPTLASMLAAKSQLNDTAVADLTLAQDKVTKVCAIATAPETPITLVDVQDMVNTGIPKLIAVVDASGLDKQAKAGAEIALTAAQFAINTQLAKLPVTTTGL